MTGVTTLLKSTGGSRTRNNLLFDNKKSGKLNWWTLVPRTETEEVNTSDKYHGLPKGETWTEGLTLSCCSVTPPSLDRSSRFLGFREHLRKERRYRGSSGRTCSVLCLL